MVEDLKENIKNGVKKPPAISNFGIQNTEWYRL